MAVGAWFLVLCPDCPLDEMHGDMARARRAARDHHHAGTTVISVASIQGAHARRGARHPLGWIVTGGTSQWLEKETAPVRKPSRLQYLLARSDVA